MELGNNGGLRDAQFQASAGREKSICQSSARPGYCRGTEEKPQARRGAARLGPKTAFVGCRGTGELSQRSASNIGHTSPVASAIKVT